MCSNDRKTGVWRSGVQDIEKSVIQTLKSEGPKYACVNCSAWDRLSTKCVGLCNGKIVRMILGFLETSVLNAGYMYNHISYLDLCTKVYVYISIYIYIYIYGWCGSVVGDQCYTIRGLSMFFFPTGPTWARLFGSYFKSTWKPLNSSFQRAWRLV